MIHETYPSIFEKGGHNNDKDPATPSRMIKPSSFSTPKPGTPKRSRSESPNDKITGIKTIRFSAKEDDLLDMNLINPVDAKEEDIDEADDDTSLAEVPTLS